MKRASGSVGLPVLAALLLAACGGREEDRTAPFPLGESSALSTCADAGMPMGVDVSQYDENSASPNWSKIRDAGVVFAFARISDGLNFPDPDFAANWSQMKSVGMIRGSYQFFEPDQDPHAQAQMVLDDIPDFGPGDLPPVIDVETLDNLDAGTAAAAVAAWVLDIQTALNRRPLIYTSARVWNEFNNPPLAADLWVVNLLSSSAPQCPALPPDWSNWTFWQYSFTGTVAGLTAEGTDLDRFNGTLAQLETYAQGPADAGDGGISDGGNEDAGTRDAGESDAGPSDAGAGDGGDAGDSDAGNPDGGFSDAGNSDAGDSDGGEDGGAAPIASLTSPAANAVLSGIVTVHASAAGAATIEIFLDGALLATGSNSPFSTSWDTRQSVDGPHDLQVRAYSSSLVEGDSPGVLVRVDNSAATGCPSGTVDAGGACVTACPSGTSLDGGVCVGASAATSGGCSSAGEGWFALFPLLSAISLRRKRTLRAPRKPC